MSRLIRLYPAQWRQRYGVELEQLVDDLRPTASRAVIAKDLLKGAISAHVRQARDGSRRYRRAIRHGGLIVGLAWLGLSAEILLTNVIFPARDDSTVEILASYLFVFAALSGIGVLAAVAGAARRVRTLAGAVAGALIGELAVVSIAVVDNVWLDVVGRQPQKIDGFAHSGATSMRAYVNHGLIGPAIFALIAFGITGAIMATIGGTIVDRFAASSATNARQLKV